MYLVSCNYQNWKQRFFWLLESFYFRKSHIERITSNIYHMASKIEFEFIILGYVMITNLRLFLIQYQLLIYWTKPKNPKSIYVEKEANEIHFVLSSTWLTIRRVFFKSLLTVNIANPMPSTFSRSLVRES